MKKVFKAEMWDKMQYLFRNYYDRMMHCVLYYDAPVDEALIRRAAEFQISRVPVLHSRYHNNFVKPYWVEQEWRVEDAFSVTETDDLERSVMAFVEQRIPIKSNMQIRIGLFRSGEKSALAFVVNHMCFDGGDLKYFVTQLAKNYTKLQRGETDPHHKGGDARLRRRLFRALRRGQKSTRSPSTATSAR